MTRKLNRWVLVDGELLRKDITAYMLEKGLSLRPACDALGIVYATLNNAFIGKRIDYKTVGKLRELGFTVRVVWSEPIAKTKIKEPKTPRINTRSSWMQLVKAPKVKAEKE